MVCVYKEKKIVGLNLDEFFDARVMKDFRRKGFIIKKYKKSVSTSIDLQDNNMH